MRVQYIPFAPTAAATEAGRPALSPELLAASGARYSRNDEGLGAILEKVDFANPDKSVDSIFRMVDYGHRSIARLTSVPMFMDGVSIFLAYYLWSMVPAQTASGQESSTRYIKMGPEGLLDPNDLGIPEKDQARWRTTMEACFAAYQEAVEFWEELSRKRPELMRIPKSLLEDKSEKAQKQVERMRRNFAFDRARVFLPVAAKTNVMMVNHASGWVDMISQLLSLPWPEAQELGTKLREELELATPRLIKHARFAEGTAAVFADEFEFWQSQADRDLQREAHSQYSAVPSAYVRVVRPPDANERRIQNALKHRVNRYSFVGSMVARTMVTYGWHAVSLAEIRDMNRHSPGTKYCPLIPVGFYTALDQVPSDMPEARAKLQALEAKIAPLVYEYARTLLREGRSDYLYFTALGVQFPFEHHNTGDKYVYEAELRTGLGAHYRYAQHYRESLAEWYRQMPETQGLVLEGEAEPE